MYISDATSIGSVFFSGTVNIILIAITVLSIVFVVWSRMKERAQETRRAGQAGTGRGLAAIERVGSAMQRLMDRDLLSALVLFCIGAVSLAQAGTDPRNWIFPRLATYLILAVAALLLARVSSRRS